MQSGIMSVCYAFSTGGCNMTPFRRLIGYRGVLNANAGLSLRFALQQPHQPLILLQRQSWHYNT